jgi:hypothetical protein
MHNFEIERSYIEAECREAGEADLARERQAARKDTWLDRAICPGCGLIFTRTELAQLLSTGPYLCPSCDYKHVDKPHRPLTIREITEGRFRAPGVRPSCYDDVDLEGYTRALMHMVARGSEDDQA